VAALGVEGFNQQLALEAVANLETDERFRYWACYMVSQLHNSLMLHASKLGGKVEKTDLCTLAQLLGPRQSAPKQTSAQQHEATAAALKAMCGL